MPWSAANFLRLHNWQADRDLGIRIRADRMDAEFDNFKTGLEQLLLRNGANSPTADIDWGGKKIVNLASGTAPGEAATYGQVMAEVGRGGWVTETRLATLAGARSFTIAGDARAEYSYKRRLWLVADGATIYASVAPPYNVFAGGFTTVTVETDNDSALAGTLDSVKYSSLINPLAALTGVPPSGFAGSSMLPPGSHAVLSLNNSAISYTPAGSTLIVPLNGSRFNARNEYDAVNYGFKPKQSGLYLVNASLAFSVAVTGLMQLLVDVSFQPATPIVTPVYSKVVQPGGNQMLKFTSVLPLERNSVTQLKVICSQTMSIFGANQSDPNAYTNILDTSLQIFRLS